MEHVSNSGELRPQPISMEELEQLVQRASMHQDEPELRADIIKQIAGQTFQRGTFSPVDDELYFLGTADYILAVEAAGLLTKDEVDLIFVD